MNSHRKVSSSLDSISQSESKLKASLKLFKRLENKTCEVVWKGNPSRPDHKTDIYTGNFINGQYSPPNGFVYGPFQPNDDAIVLNKRSDAYNVPEMIKLALDTATEYSNAYSQGSNNQKSYHSNIFCRPKIECPRNENFAIFPAHLQPHDWYDHISQNQPPSCWEKFT